MPWPRSIPEDLRRRLEGVMGYRSFGPAEIWDTLREWLESEGIDPPFKPPLKPPSNEG